MDVLRIEMIHVLQVEMSVKRTVYILMCRLVLVIMKKW